MAASGEARGRSLQDNPHGRCAARSTPSAAFLAVLHRRGLGSSQLPSGVWGSAPRRVDERSGRAALWEEVSVPEAKAQRADVYSPSADVRGRLSTPDWGDSMSRKTASALMVLALALSVVARAQFASEPLAPELLALAEPLTVDIPAYGCGPLLQPGNTCYVALSGADDADGGSWETAWRTIKHGVAQLRAGDTLIIGDGEYIEPLITMNVEVEQSGEPGRPITITAAPRARVVITGGLQPQLSRVPGTQYCSRAAIAIPDAQAAVWETDTQILLQKTGSLAMCEELPATWWYDADAQLLHVHFSDSRGPDVHGVSVRLGKGSTSNFYTRDTRGLDIRGSFVHLNGLHIQNYHTGLLITGNAIEGDAEPRQYRGGDHITVQNCSFGSMTFAGMVLWAGARWNLMQHCYGALNGDRGTMLVNHADAADNLFIHNRFDSSAPTIRERGWQYHYGISTYGHVGRRNHIIGNVMNDVQSFRSKYTFLETTVQGNVMLGACSLVECTYPGFRADELVLTPEDRVIFRDNVLLGPVSTSEHRMHESGPGGTWADKYKVFVNNYAPGAAGVAREDAGFADPAWLDYRLQSDSPLRGAGLGGRDIGAVVAPAGRIFYVAPTGDDANVGTSERLAFATLGKAAGQLAPGDTLYIMPGDYAEPLTISASGAEGNPITIRAHHKAEVTLPGVSLAGSSIVVEGLIVTGAASAGIEVSGDAVTLRECIITGCGGPGINADGATNLNIERCTIWNNETGIALRSASTGARVRECIIADNRTATAEVTDDSLPGYAASHNCYWPTGPSGNPEWGSVVADPLLIAPAQGDCRLAWDSPAAHRALYGRPAGARGVLSRVPEIERVDVAANSADTAVVTWTTPRDDTTGSARYRAVDTDRWQTVRGAALGTVHGLALTGLQPATEYEFTVGAKGLRGGESSSEPLRFTTPADGHTPTTYYLSPSGDDAADGLTPPTAWRTIRRANFAVMAGDTVLIAPGEYHHPIAPLCGGTADQRITYRREGEGVAMVDAMGVIAPLVELPGRNFITVDGLTFDRLPPEGHDGVIKVDSCEGFELLGCRIGYSRPHGGFGNALTLYRCPGARIEGNVIWGTRYHFTLNQCPGSLIKNNTVLLGQVFSTYFIGDHSGCRFINNIMYRPTSVPNAAVAINQSEGKLELLSDYNCWGPMVPGTRPAYVYARSLNDLAFTGATVAEWAANTGLDGHSIEADPLFLDLNAGDFRLAPGSPAIGAGEGGINMGALDERLLQGRTGQ